MDRKGIIAITIALIALFAWQTYYSRQMEQYRKVKEAADQAAAAKAKAEHPELEVATPPAPGTPPAGTTAEPAAAEQIETLSTNALEYSFTNLGGGIARLVLLGHVAESGNLRAGDHEKKVTLNAYGDIPIGAVSERAGVETRVPFTASFDREGGAATFERTDARQVRMVKRFTFPKTSDSTHQYVTGLDLSFTNGGGQPVQMGGYYVHTGAAGPIHQLDQALYTGFDWFDGGNHFRAITSFSSGGLLGFGRTDQPLFSQTVANVKWAAVTNQYFATILTPAKVEGASVWANKLMAAHLPDSTPGAAPATATIPYVEGALGMPGFTLPPGETVTQHFDIFSGPREYNGLKALGNGQEEIMDFGTFIGPVSKLLLNSMNWLHARLGSYAAAIIVLTLIIRSLMWPLQNKSTESMKKMQALTPKMNELKERYQDDPQRMNMEVMKLYKTYGVNPLSGCLPMFIQIPIFFGLFRMLGKAVELRNSHFLWVHDLSQPDTVAILFGFPLNVLPLCMAATMFFQMRLSPKSGDAAQQRIFMFMPLIFVAFCYNYASALALYWTVQNLFSIVQLYVTRNKETPVLQKVAGPSKKKGRS